MSTQTNFPGTYTPDNDLKRVIQLFKKPEKVRISRLHSTWRKNCFRNKLRGELRQPMSRQFHSGNLSKTSAAGRSELGIWSKTFGTRRFLMAAKSSRVVAPARDFFKP